MGTSKHKLYEGEMFSFACEISVTNLNGENYTANASKLLIKVCTSINKYVYKLYLIYYVKALMFTYTHIQFIVFVFIYCLASWR